MVGRYTHAHQFKRAQRELKFLRTRLGRIIRDIRRKIEGTTLNRSSAILGGPWITLRQALQERPEPGLKCRIVRGCGDEHTYAPPALRLLRAHAEWPHRHATEQRDE